MSTNGNGAAPGKETPFAPPPESERIEPINKDELFPILNSIIPDFGTPTKEDKDKDGDPNVFAQLHAHVSGQIEGLFGEGGEPPEKETVAEPAVVAAKKHHDMLNLDGIATMGQRLLFSIVIIGAHVAAALYFSASAELVVLFGSIAQLFAMWQHNVLPPLPEKKKASPASELKAGAVSASAEATKLATALGLSAIGRPVAGSSMTRFATGYAPARRALCLSLSLSLSGLQRRPPRHRRTARGPSARTPPRVELTVPGVVWSCVWLLFGWGSLGAPLRAIGGGWVGGWCAARRRSTLAARRAARIVGRAARRRSTRGAPCRARSSSCAAATTSKTK
jgi:hypothetical protein